MEAKRETQEDIRMSQLPRIAIIELGSQYTLLIERTLREQGFRSVVLEPRRAKAWLEKNSPQAVILSGGGASVYDKDVPQPPLEVLDPSCGHALLGICYGMQWIAHTLGGRVEPISDNREYGDGSITVITEDWLFDGMPPHQKVWMSHGDSVTQVPEGFETLAFTETGAIAAIRKGLVWGLQFHPEVTHTTYGAEMLIRFLKAAGCEPDWEPSALVDDIRNKTLDACGIRRAVFGFSGGVDSTTLAAILAPALKQKLLAITIDGGHLRKNELTEIEKHAHAAGVLWKIVDARAEFVAALAGTVDAEEKRRRFKKVYQDIFAREARVFGAEIVLQGTLAPDRIESGATGGALIKSHHNVGLDMGEIEQLHPIDHLFKYEIRALGRELGLPESVWNRQPFPGPGLFLRIIGTPITIEKLDLVRWADACVREILVRHGVYDSLSQVVVAYVDAHTVGVKGDARAYGGAIVVRAIETVDFMTARGVWLPQAIVYDISRTLVAHPSVVRVWFDPTDKPPATTEME